MSATASAQSCSSPFCSEARSSALRRRRCSEGRFAQRRAGMRAAAANLGAMVRAKAQRTLVKSPPELWSELSDEQTLRAHLAGLSDVRITSRVEERRIEWQASGARGSIEIEPSGWGTKVMLSLERDDHGSAQSSPAQTPPSPAEALGERRPEPMPEGPAAAPSTPTAAVGPPARTATDPALPDLGAGPAPEPPAGSEPEWPTLRRRSLRARIGALLRIASPERRRQRSRQTERPGGEAPRDELPPGGSGHDVPGADGLEAEFERLSAAVLAPARPHGASPQAAEEPAADAPDDPVKAGASSGQLTSAGIGYAPDESLRSAQELLSSLLDRLGEAHHRPFSRA